MPYLCEPAMIAANRRGNRPPAERRSMGSLGFDPTVPNWARLYDFWLGGKDNFAADREAARAALKIAPELVMICREGRRFLNRAVRFLTDAGIRQFVDIGCGLPTQGNVHEIALEAAPDSRVVYVDNDPVVVVHAQALLADDERTIVIEGDARAPGEILGHPRLRQTLDLDQPVAVLLLSMMAAIPDDDVVRALVMELRDGIAPGSYLAISHAISDPQPCTTSMLAGLFKEKGMASGRGRGQLRTRADIEPLFDGLELVEPGLVHTPVWRPEPGEDCPSPEKVWVLGGVGYKK
jgi:SAM-dependent methyltransferase